MNFWDDSVSEYDLIQEDAIQAEEMASRVQSEPVILEPSQEEAEEILEESAYDLDEEETGIVFNAKLRLEQAKLYELLINHNFFEGVDASEKAINVVQNELKYYIVKRLEILLGLRKEAPVKTQQAGPSPFNSVEIDFLKQFAYKGTFGKSIEAEEEGEEVGKSIPTPVKKAGLSPIRKQLPGIKGSQLQKQQPPPAQKKLAQKSTPPVQTKTKKKPSKNVKEEAPNNKPSTPSFAGRNLTAEEIERIAKEDLKALEKRKAWNKMTTKEKEEEAKKLAQRYTKKDIPNKTPIPTADQLEYQYMMQQQKQSAFGSEQSKFNSMLSSIMLKRAMEKGD